MIYQIEMIIAREIDNDKRKRKDNQYSKFTLKVAQTIAFIYKYSYINFNIVKMCINVLSSKIKKLIEKIKIYSNNS